MSKFDQQNLRNALSEREESVMDMVTHSFRGKSRWLSIISWVKMIFFILAAAACAIQFFRTDSTKALIGWASLFVVFSLGMSILFVLYWLELNRNAVTRELKRLELRIAELTHIQ
ncbi:hypothetical protein BH09PLA1_BH09PLA1_32110 [soil metagenome]